MTHTIVMGIPFVIAPALPSRPTLSAAIAANTPPMASRRLICAAGGFVGCIRGSMQIARQERFVYHQSMNVEDHADAAVSRIAAAIGELARARMLYCLVDGRARTSTELAIVADVTPSTASVHLQRLKAQRLVKVFAQGKHRYYSLEGANVAAARTCYDHIAGTLGVSLHDRFMALGWLSGGSGVTNAYDLTPDGAKAFGALGIDVEATRTLRRRFAYACVDWSERRPHLGGAVGAALLNIALKRKWVTQDLDSRALTITGVGRREMLIRFGLRD